MKIKKGDNVMIMAGKDKGKTGAVERVFPALSTVVVAGLNKRKKHERARKSDQKGQVIEKSFPLHMSNVMIVDKKTGKATRIQSKMVGDKKVRVTQKSGAEI